MSENWSSLPTDDYNIRLRTFQAYPAAGPVSAERLAEAGFVYEGRGDKVICPRCRARLHDWLTTSDPLQEHIRFVVGDCDFLVKKYGSIAAAKVAARRTRAPESQRTNPPVSRPQHQRTDDNTQTVSPSNEESRNNADSSPRAEEGRITRRQLSGPTSNEQRTSTLTVQRQVSDALVQQYLDFDTMQLVRSHLSPDLWPVLFSTVRYLLRTGRDVISQPLFVLGLVKSRIVR